MSPAQPQIPSLFAMLIAWRNGNDTAQIARQFGLSESHVANCLAQHFDQRHRDKQGRASA